KIVSDLSELAGKGKILVVDDEKNLRILLRDLLSKYGYDCIEAENGLEAVRAVKREETDLVILDLIMPVCDGIEAFSRIRELSPEKRILICSGFNKDKEIRNMLAQGGVDFIQKPFTERAILTKIKTLLK
ncbi:MAG: response regulator, partial [Deltaproteobacteria bacterium]|nr:response regulator [Deltaproteobacteria bacterium]